MRKLKYIIPIFLFFIAIGYAAISASLSIEGDALIVSDYDDYKVYFSRVLVNGVEKDNVVDSETKLVFAVRLVEPGEEYVLTYDVTNGSKYFDASVTMSCTGGDANIGINNQFDTSNMPSLSTRTGVLTVKKLKSNSSQENIAYSITCNLVAESIDRTSPGSGEVLGPLPPYKYKVGTEIVIANERFNVISSTDDTVTMLAQYNLGTDYRQSSTNNYVYFTESGGWENFPGPKEIDIQTYSTNPKVYVNEYVSYLKKLTLDDSLSGDLISLMQLKELGCFIDDDYGDRPIDDNEYTCASSSYFGWIKNNQTIWTKSANSYYGSGVWVIKSDGTLVTLMIDYVYTDYEYGIRPVITISKEALNKRFIEFTIDGVWYAAEEGMTWSEWVNSDYNTGGFLVTGNDLVLKGTMVVSLVYGSEKISSGVSYNLEPTPY